MHRRGLGWALVSSSASGWSLSSSLSKYRLDSDVLDSGIFDGKISAAARERDEGEGEIRERKGVRV